MWGHCTPTLEHVRNPDASPAMQLISILEYRARLCVKYLLATDHRHKEYGLVPLAAAISVQPVRVLCVKRRPPLGAVMINRHLLKAPPS